jgi:hypothetical protein
MSERLGNDTVQYVEPGLVAVPLRTIIAPMMPPIKTTTENGEENKGVIFQN